MAKQASTIGLRDMMTNPTGQRWMYDYLEKNPEVKGIFNGMIAEFAKGMGLQNQVAQVQLGNAAAAAAGFRPGQYMSARQRREAMLAATDPDAARAEKIARLNFHGGVVNGKWVTTYDEWKAAGDKQHTDSKGKPIEVTSLGFESWRRKPLTDKDVIEGTVVKDKEGNDVVMKGPPGAVVRGMSRLADGDYRGVRRGRDGSIIYTFGGDGNRADVRREALTRLSLYDGKTDKQREAEWQMRPEWGASPDPSALRRVRSPSWVTRPVNAARDFLSGMFSASKGGETMRERGWLDAVFARAERAAARGGRTRR